MVAIEPSSAAADNHCPPGQKVCEVSGEAPISGLYRLNQGGGLTVTKSAHGYAVRDLHARLGQKDGCSLSGRLAAVAGSQQLSKQGKSFFVGAGETETTYTWRSHSRDAKIRVGEQTYTGALFTKFLDVDGTQSVEGHLRFEPEEGVVCEGLFLGVPTR
jgi:hypothetical protein